ncbi:MAG: sigma 54-interacting transcriptional regulator [Pseudomonadota bacterium]
MPISSAPQPQINTSQARAITRHAVAYGVGPRDSLSDAGGHDSGGHKALLDPVLPLLSAQWQRARLSIGADGAFPNPPGCRPEERLELDLRQGERAAIRRLGTARVALTYSEATLEAARSALCAIASYSGASKGGWPIARDGLSLALLTLSERIAASPIPVLLEGPTGTGKEVLARFVHRRSPRADGPFVAVNCAAMPEAMLEGLLFGHRKGAFTGAGETREGLFRAAHGGTLLLDEIGELPLPLQAKLLRALQEGEVLPLGATTPIEVDVRVIAATNRQLASEVLAGRFREDLLYRLNVFPLEIAALRDRPADIAPLAFGMLLRHAGGTALREGGAGPAWISGQALALLEAHTWPGNVRELENVIRRAILLAGDEPRVGSEHIVFDQPVRALAGEAQEAAGAAPMAPQVCGGGASLSDIAFQSEAQAILAALEDHGGHRARTAKALGISERTLRYRMASMRESGLWEEPRAPSDGIAGGEA